MASLKKILVVDDDSINLKAIDHLLRSFGYSTVTASSGPEALEQLSQDIQMVLLDVMMPEMDGFEVARRIRAHPDYGDVPIIMVTGLTRKEDRLAAVQAGANDFVSKPLDRVELDIRISSHLKLKEAQDRRRESDARYRMLVENSPVGILSCNRNGEITEINAAAANLFDIPYGEAGVRHNLFDNPELNPSGVADSLRACLESGEMVVNELPVGTQGNKHARLYVVPLWDRDGSASGLQVVSEDISDQKRVDELNRRGTRLRAFAEMARGAVMHFSDALDKIVQNADAGLAAVESDNAAGVRPALDQILTVAERSSQTLRLLEKFARGYSKRDTPTWTSLDFSEAVREALESTKPSWAVEPAKRGVEIKLEFDFVKGCLVAGDKGDLVEMAGHLIRNAAEAMQRGGSLRVRTSLQGDHAVLTVQDDGVGMSQEQMKRIGYPFRTSKQAHVGLGLAVSFGIIRRHFGTFSVSSRRGRGTVFLVKFPLAAKRKETTTDGTLELASANPRTLFVDPDARISDRIPAELQGKGPMYFARSIEEAVQTVHEKNIDAIVCSEVIPSTEIVELGRRVSAFFASKGTVRPPFIMLGQEHRPESFDPSLSEAYVDRVVDTAVDVVSLTQIVGEEVRSAITRPRIAGALGQIDVLDVVQMMLLSGQQLVLEVISEQGTRGLLYIAQGEICHAACGALEGDEAVFWALGLRSGSFATLAWVEPERHTIDTPGALLLLEAARRRDETKEPHDDDEDDDDPQELL
jgi:PAS domain S-box-containing protein